MFAIKKRERVEQKPSRTMVVGKVGNTNQNVVQKEGKLFIQEKKMFGMKETPIIPAGEAGGIK